MKIYVDFTAAVFKLINVTNLFYPRVGVKNDATDPATARGGFAVTVYYISELIADNAV